MTMAKIKVYYFSPTGGTLLVARHLAEKMGMELHVEVEYHSYTLLQEREVLPIFDAGDIVLWATPVYAGRIPNTTLDYVRNAIKGSGNLSVALVTFGNRAYDNALAELVGLMEEGGLQPVGAAAVVTRHAFSDTLGAGRPDKEDLAAIDHFAKQLAEKIVEGQKHLNNQSSNPIKVPGEAHPEKYYTPLKTNSAPAGFLKARPTCDLDRCTRCGKCLEVCPMGSIVPANGTPTFVGTCIKCQACRHSCPTGAIAFTDPEYLSHVAMIERTFAEPKRSEFFVSTSDNKGCMKYYIVDAFTDKPFGGNPAGVVLVEGDSFPPEGLMLRIAAELRYSETAFIRRHSTQEFTIRYFTPKAEVELCGHATIASFFLLHKKGLAQGPCLCHTKAGDLTIAAGEKVLMQMAKPSIVATIDDTDDIYSALGMHGQNVFSPFKVQIVSAGLPDIMIPLPDVATLQSLQPDMEAIAAITKRYNAVSFHVFAFGDDGYTAHVRDFAPLYDIPEESATGTANASLTYYLQQNGHLGVEAECAFMQGEAMGRPSVVATRIDADGTIYVGGTAAIVAEGTLFPDFSEIQWFK